MSAPIRADYRDALRRRHAALCEQVNEEATPFRESPNRVACAERDRIWAELEALEEADLAEEALYDARNAEPFK